MSAVRVLLFSQYFTPEIGATQTRVHAIAAALAGAGHDVEVICEVPNHPQGVVHAGFRGRPVLRRRLDGFRVIYTWVATRPEKTTFSRLAFYGSYAAMASAVGMLRPRPDVVLASSPPLPVAAAAALVAKRHRAPWVFDVRDLWPAAAVAMGELRQGVALRLAERLENALYEDAAAITVVTEAFREHVVGRVGSNKTVELVPNGTTRFWLDGAGLELDKADVGLPRDRFVWTFAGNVGRAQGLETAIEVAAALGEGFHLLVLGDGPARRDLERLAERLRAPVEFCGQVQPSEAVRYLRASDALLVSLSADPRLASFVPSKLYDFCALGKPVVLAAAGESQRLAGEHRAALAVPPGDPGALAAALRSLAGDADLRKTLGAAGRSFAGARLRETHTAAIAAVLEAAARAH